MMKANEEEEGVDASSHEMEDRVDDADDDDDDDDNIMSLLSTKMNHTKQHVSSWLSHWWFYKLPNSHLFPSFLKPVHSYICSAENRDRVGTLFHRGVTIVLMLSILSYLFYLVIIRDLIMTDKAQRKHIWVPTIGFFFWMFLAYLTFEGPFMYASLKKLFYSRIIGTRNRGRRIRRRRSITVDLENNSFSERQDSERKGQIDFECIIWGCSAQFILGMLVLHWSYGFQMVEKFGNMIHKVLSMSDVGAKFVFGETFQQHYIAFKVLPTIIYFSAVVSLLYYIGVLQFFLRIFSWLMMKTMHISGAESLIACGNIFLGQSEAPLLIKPFVAHLTKSELLCVMTAGMASVSGSVMGAFIGVGVSVEHLVTASVMSCPATIAVSKLMLPETEEPVTKGTIQVEIEKEGSNVIEAITNGAISGGLLAWNIAVMAIAFTSILALINLVLGAIGGFLFHYPNLSIEWFFSFMFAPFAVMMGVPLEDAFQVGTLLGKKTFLNEFVAYLDMMQMIKEGKLTARSITITTYALCGFASFMSIGIQIAGLSTLAPHRKTDISRLGLRSLIGGTLACFMTASIAAILIP